MLEGKKPAVESIARLVPHDNYYVHFKNIRKFMEFGDLLDQWGTSVLRVYEMKSRDAQLRSMPVLPLSNWKHTATTYRLRSPSVVLLPKYWIRNR